MGLGTTVKNQSLPKRRNTRPETAYAALEYFGKEQATEDRPRHEKPIAGKALMGDCGINEMQDGIVGDIDRKACAGPPTRP